MSRLPVCGATSSQGLVAHTRSRHKIEEVEVGTALPPLPLHDRLPLSLSLSPCRRLQGRTACLHVFLSPPTTPNELHAAAAARSSTWQRGQAAQGSTAQVGSPLGADLCVVVLLVHRRRCRRCQCRSSRFLIVNPACLSRPRSGWPCEEVAAWPCHVRCPAPRCSALPRSVLCCVSILCLVFVSSIEKSWSRSRPPPRPRTQ